MQLCIIKTGWYLNVAAISSGPPSIVQTFLLLRQERFKFLRVRCQTQDCWLTEILPHGTHTQQEPSCETLRWLIVTCSKLRSRFQNS